MDPGGGHADDLGLLRVEARERELLVAEQERHDGDDEDADGELEAAGAGGEGLAVDHAAGVEIHRAQAAQ
ncbi:hypothetical protein D3C72_1554410 [compost metagenome]